MYSLPDCGRTPPGCARDPEDCPADDFLADAARAVESSIKRSAKHNDTSHAVTLRTCDVLVERDGSALSVELPLTFVLRVSGDSDLDEIVSFVGGQLGLLFTRMQ